MVAGLVFEGRSVTVPDPAVLLARLGALNDDEPIAIWPVGSEAAGYRQFVHGALSARWLMADLWDHQLGSAFKANVSFRRPVVMDQSYSRHWHADSRGAWHGRVRREDKDYVTMRYEVTQLAHDNVRRADSLTRLEAMMALIELCAYQAVPVSTEKHAVWSGLTDLHVKALMFDSGTPLVAKAQAATTNDPGNQAVTVSLTSGGLVVATATCRLTQIQLSALLV